MQNEFFKNIWNCRIYQKGSEQVDTIVGIIVEIERDLKNYNVTNEFISDLKNREIIESAQGVQWRLEVSWLNGNRLVAASNK